MALRSQLVQLPFGQGLDQKTDAHQVAPGKLLTALNLRFDKNGAIRKRFGVEHVGDTGSAGAKVHACGSEAVTYDTSGAVASYSATRALLLGRGQVPEALLTRSGLYANTFSPGQMDVAYGNGVYVYVWCGSGTGTGGVYAMIVDATTGAEVLSPQRVSASGTDDKTYPRVCFLSSTNQFVVAYKQDATSNILGVVISSTWSPGAEATIVSDCRNATAADFEIMGLSTTFLFVYQDTTARAAKLLELDTSYAVIHSAFLSDASTDAKTGFGLAGSSADLYWVSYASAGGGTRKAIVDAFTASTFAELGGGFPLTLYSTATNGPLYTCPVRLSATQAMIGFSSINNKSTSSMAPVVSSAGAVVSNASATNRRTFWTYFASKPFVGPNGSAYAWLCTTPAADGLPAESQYSYVLCDLGTADKASTNLQARALSLTCARVAQPENPNSSAPQIAFPARPCSVINPATNVYITGGRLKKTNAGRPALVSLKATFASNQLYQGATLGNTLHVSPGYTYDGSASAEIGFMYAPQGVVVTAGGGGSGSMAAGNYAYVVCYAFTDKQGNVHRSQPSPPVAVTGVPASGSVTIEVPYLTLTERQTSIPKVDEPSVVLDVYRTLVGGTTDGPFYKLYSDASTPPNRKNVDFVTITDTVADGSLASSPQIYTAGSVLENVAPPSLSTMVAYRGRFFAIGDDGTIYFTKAYVDGDAVAFCDEFNLRLNDESPPTALGVMDEKLIIFTRSSIYAMAGEGPDDRDVGSDYGTPVRVSSDLGCIDQRSVVLTPAGLMFQSAVGLYLLSRGMDVQFIGHPVDDLITSFPNIASATVHPSGTHVLFCADNGTNGVRLMLDYRASQWGHDELGAPVPYASGSGAWVASQTVVGGTLYSLLHTGALVRESSSSYLDQVTGGSATWVTFRIESANVALSGIQGYQRARWLSLLGTRYTSHDLTIELANDFADTFYRSELWPAVRLDSIPLEEVQQHISRQKCAAIRVRITDATPTSGSVGTGRGASLTGLLFDIGAKPGRSRVAEGQKG